MVEDNGSRDWSIYLTGFLIGSIERVFPGTAKSVEEGFVGENYFIVTLGEEKKTRLKVTINAEICEDER